MFKRSRSSHRGQAILEMALFSPWIFFIFVGAFDWGFYSYALIATESAARTAAQYTSASGTNQADAATACTIALGIMRKLPNVGAGVTSCGSSPVTVTAVAGTATDGTTDTVVSVTYSSGTFIPIPGLLTGRLQVTRVVKMRVRS